MGIWIHRLSTVLALSVLTTGCFWEDQGSSGDSRKHTLPDEPQGEVLSIITQWPQDQAEHIAPSASLAVQFDAALHPASLLDGLTYLVERDSSRRIDCKLRLEDGNRTLIVDPLQDLALETRYVCHLSPLLVDLSERLLEEDLYFTFKTKDATPPTSTSFSIINGAKNVSRHGVLKVSFDEPIDPDTVTETTVILRSSTGQDHPIRRVVIDNEVQCHLTRDLLPSHSYQLIVVGGSAGLRDPAGNQLAETISRSFTSAADDQAPSLLRSYPTSLYVSPDIQVILDFDESMDLDSVESTAFTFKDQFGNFVAFAVQAEPSQRTLRLVPNSPLVFGRNYTVRVNNGIGAITDFSGRYLQNSSSIHLLVSDDSTPPSLLSSMPSDGASRVSYNARPQLSFDESLDNRRVNSDTVTLTGPHGPLQFFLSLENSNTLITLTPTEALASGQRFTVTIKSGPMGIRDAAGNTLAQDIRVTFTTGIDRSLPKLTISPTHGHSAMSPVGTFTAAFEDPLDASTVSTDTVVVTDRLNQRVPGRVLLSNGDRIITFDPDSAYLAGQWYTVTLVDGERGIRERSGNWLSQPVNTTFRIAYTADSTPPSVTVSINQTVDKRKQGLSVSRSGFEITVYAEDPTNYDVDLGSFEVILSGPGVTPTPEAILSMATVTKDGLQFVIAPQSKLAVGEYTVHARVADLAGNVGQSERLSFKVVDFDAAVMPFERTQVVWARFDLDRDGNGRADFEDDLLKLGFIHEGDPAGLNQRMIDMLRDGMLSQAHQIFERKANGGRSGRDSIAVLLTATQPRGVVYSQMAVGGLDPNGTPHRRYGDKSSGILGRAYYDGKNANRADNNTLTNPGLGVFTGELFLFEAETHLQLYPIFLTRFARRFTKLVPEMGGTRVGADARDPIVTAEDFDLNSATLPQLQRYSDIHRAADDWATGIGVILAHEIGHTIGLVATGAPPAGLHGDNSLHNRSPNLGNVMSSAVSYDSIVSLNYRFRDINVAYLRQRLLMK